MTTEATTEAEDQQRMVHGGWLDTVRNASDLALLGILVTVGSLGVVTAGAAVAAASAAVHDWSADERWPGVRVTLGRFARGLVPGMLPALVAAIGGGLLVLNLAAITRGVVPGGVAVAVPTLLILVAAAGLAGLTVVEVGRTGGVGWRAAAKAALADGQRRPAAVLACAGVVALVAALGMMIIPVLVPVLGGYAILAMHAVARRLPAR
ncbi:hypothetical protein [Phytohabitans houttuyneae]|uniref:DUF624 domain-containing protein n=1 Tax=Phytohabitans houttuyneae TaxID=1076126 RepID=A0A6V8KEX2_9ACTN|nr:hypothetical protein [Phytohabitans houttuyneae]GFJ80237.1 hypothetical protein Phou_044170 [Phytohabitans houttuyneae]